MNGYFACVRCVEKLETREFLTEEVSYCDNEDCSRYGFLTFVSRYISKPEDKQYWLNKLDDPNQPGQEEG